MLLFVTVLFIVLLPFTALGVCVMTDICSDIQLVPIVYQRIFALWVAGCAVVLAVIFLFRAVAKAPDETHRHASATVATNVCERTSN